MTNLSVFVNVNQLSIHKFHIPIGRDFHFYFYNNIDM